MTALLRLGSCDWSALAQYWPLIGHPKYLGSQHLHRQRGDGQVLPLLPLLVLLGVEDAPHQLSLLLLTGLGGGNDGLKQMGCINSV